MLRIGVVQFEPKIGKVRENVDVATKLCAKLKRGDVDIVCLPEMVFTGMDLYVTTLINAMYCRLYIPFSNHRPSISRDTT